MIMVLEETAAGWVWYLEREADGEEVCRSSWEFESMEDAAHSFSRVMEFMADHLGNAAEVEVQVQRKPGLFQFHSGGRGAPGVGRYTGPRLEAGASWGDDLPGSYTPEAYPGGPGDRAYGGGGYYPPRGPGYRWGVGPDPGDWDYPAGG